MMPCCYGAMLFGAMQFGAMLFGAVLPCRLLPRNGCSCEAEPGLPLPLFGQSHSVDFGSAFSPEELPQLQQLREREFRRHRLR